MKNIKPISITIIALLVLVTSFYSCSNRSELKEKGVKTAAIVVDGASTKNRGRNFSTYTTYEVELEFVTANGKKVRVKESVSQQEYNTLYLRCEVPLVYLPNDPTEVDVIISDEDVLFYYGIANRPLYLEDLCAIYDKTNVDSITTFLNKISFKWVSDANESTTFWENQKKNELVAINSGVLTYVTYNYMWQNKFLSELEGKGFVKTQQDSIGSEVFENESYRIVSSRKIDSSDESMGLSVYFVVNMIKVVND